MRPRPPAKADPVKAKPKFDCAYSAFNQEYTLDPTRVDSLFFQKIIFVAQSGADSMTWARRFVQKYPTSVTALEVEAQLFTGAGQTDSAIAIVNMLTRLDSTESKPVLVVTKALIDAKHAEAALQFVPYFKKYADETAKNQYAGLLITRDSAARTDSTPRPDSSWCISARAVIDVTPHGAELPDLRQLLHGDRPRRINSRHVDAVAAGEDLRRREGGGCAALATRTGADGSRDEPNDRDRRHSRRICLTSCRRKRPSFRR